MKATAVKLVLTLCLSFIFVGIQAQQRYYCEVKGIEKELSSGLKIIFDFGTKASYNIWGDLSSKLKFVDENGEEIKFNSMVDAANYMVERGWTFQQAYSSAYGGKPINKRMMMKEAEAADKAREAIITKVEAERREGEKAR